MAKKTGATIAQGGDGMQASPRSEFGHPISTAGASLPWGRGGIDHGAYRTIYSRLCAPGDRRNAWRSPLVIKEESIATRSRPRVAVYAIARDEAPFCERFCASCDGADFVLVADTGSTDGTRDTLRRLGVAVHDISVRPWRFDVARNAALALIPAEIDVCVALDIDEILVDGWRTALDAAWEPSVARYRYEYTWSWKPDGSPGLVFWTNKIHARHGYHWVYPCHETLQRYSDPPERSRDVPGMAIHHRPDTQKSRGQYLPLLELAVREHPTAATPAFYHGRELYMRGASERAIGELERYLALPEATWAEQRSEAMVLIARCHARLGDTDGALRWAEKAVAECPTRREVWCELARRQRDRQDWEACYAACIEALKRTERSRSYLNDERVWGGLPHELAAVAAYHTGRYEEACSQGIAALEFDPTDARARENLRSSIAKLPLWRRPFVGVRSAVSPLGKA